jgi:hypothetical protein
MHNLTEQRAYKSMFYFMDMMYRKLGWKQLGPLLGSMSLIDGQPADLALVEDWKAAIEATANIKDVSAITDQQAYAAMFHFLDEMYKRKKNELGALVESMLLVDGMPVDNSLAESWQKAVEFVGRGGQASPMVLEKDGVLYEVNRQK